MNIKIETRRRIGVAGKLMLTFIAGFGMIQAMAQDLPAGEAAPKNEESARLETVTVTGSRISNPNVVSPTPVSVLTAADIKAVGAINIGDILTRMPQLATTFTMGNSTRFIGTAGVQEQDLRNLGTNRTLVLVNGRRFVGSAAGDTGVDVNLIPADWIDRVEIITGGASAVYGADAVSGVVNFILKKNYQGANLHAQIGTSEHGGFDEKFISATGGTNFADDRGNAAFSLEHSRQDSLDFADRFGHQNFRAIQTPGGATNTVLLPNAGSYLINNGGTFSFGTQFGANSDARHPERHTRYVFDPDGSVRAQRFDGPYDNSGTCQDCDRSDTNQVLQLQPGYNRTTLSTTASFDVTPSNRLYFEGTYSSIDSKQRSQPAFGSGAGAYIITADNAYATDALRSLMAANNADSINISRFDVDAGRRGEDTSRNTGRVVFGANGLLTDKWEYDASVVYGVTRETRENTGNRIVERFFASIDAVRDANGHIVCRSTLDPTSINPNTGDVISAFGREGCIPTSIFGDGAVNAAAANWFNTTTTTRSKLTQAVASGTLTNNDLFTVPTGAGSASLVAGFEYRRETSRQDNDPLDISGQTFLNAIPSFAGSYNVKEGFVEFALPVLADKPFVKNLTFDAAVRESSYDTIGHTQAWRWGLDWAFDDNVRLRGTMSSAVRAPNIGELFSGQSQNFFNIVDPCSVSQLPNAPNRAVRVANCAALGIPADFQSGQSATVGGISGSNPDLKPETGRTYTLGFVITPQFLEGFSFNADYWNIKLSNAVGSPSGQDIVNRCVDSTTGINNQYCANNTRDPANHEVNFVSQTLINLSALNTSGIDFGASYSHDLGPGRLRLDANATRVIAFTEFPFQDDPTSRQEDNGTNTAAGAFPEWKATLSTSYSMNNWLFNWNARYFSSMIRVLNESFAANPTQTTPITAGSRTYHDARVAYGVLKEGWQVYGGITNLFDRNPPVNFFGTGGGSSIYEVMGRSYYVGANYNF
jgi:outer membrane receptor protein involved in Fe transport